MPLYSSQFWRIKKIITQSRNQSLIVIVFSKPYSTVIDWEKDFLWESAKNMKDVVCFIDSDQKETQLFGATTSGYVLLYDKNDRLIFNGGITSSRGHEGDNLGQLSLSNFFQQGSVLESQAQVFGCPVLPIDCHENFQSKDMHCCVSNSKKENSE